MTAAVATPMKDLSKYQCYQCNRTGHVSKDCKMPRDTQCFTCFQLGHVSKDCKMVGKKEPSGVQCYQCNRTGHVSKDCKMPKDTQCFTCFQLGHVSKDCKLVGQKEVPVMPFAHMNGLLGAGLNQRLVPGVESPCCIWVTGLPEEFVDADLLCNIFGNYGNVKRINFSKKKADGALIEMNEAKKAENCVRYLNNIRINGQNISVSRSKIQKIEHVANDGKSKDFSRERANRFNKDRNTKRDSRFTKILMRRLSTPTPIVLVSNMPEGKGSELKGYLVESGFTVKDMEAGKSRKAREAEEGKNEPKLEEKETSKTDMAFVEFASTEDAVKAVAKLHRSKPARMGDWSKLTRGINLSFTNKHELRQA